MITASLQTTNKVKGIDSIRFVCAVIVLLSHFGIPLPESMHIIIPNNVFELIKSASNVLFNGPAAVVVFFIISGFCIHYPNIGKDDFKVIPFYSRRFIRIIIPALLALALWRSVGLIPSPPTYGVFWSVICELVYYIVYPLLLWMRRRVNWTSQITVSYIIAYSIVFFNLNLLLVNQDYPALVQYTWLVGLPCWLLGCWLAENYNRLPKVSLSGLWAIRVALFIVACILKIVRFHLAPPFSSYIITLNILAIPACIWLGLEIVYIKNKLPNKILEWGGEWSYSLYIVHMAIPAALLALNINSVPFLNQTFLIILVSLVSSYLFYLLVEKPSHRMAVLVSKYLKKNSVQLLS